MNNIITCNSTPTNIVSANVVNNTGSNDTKSVNFCKFYIF